MHFICFGLEGSVLNVAVDCRETRPVFLELQSWPTLNFDGDPGSCPFDLKRRDKKEAAASINREIKENREKYCNPNITKVV